MQSPQFNPHTLSRPRVKHHHCYCECYVDLTIVCTVLGRHVLICPVGQSVLAQVEEGHGLEVQLAIWVGFGGHGHAVQEVWQNRVAGSGGTRRRHYLGATLPRAVADGRGGAVAGVGAGLGFSGQIFCRPEDRDGNRNGEGKMTEQKFLWIWTRTFDLLGGLHTFTAPHRAFLFASGFACQAPLGLCCVCRRTFWGQMHVSHYDTALMALGSGDPAINEMRWRSVNMVFSPVAELLTALRLSGDECQTASYECEHVSTTVSVACIHQLFKCLNSSDSGNDNLFWAEACESC